MSLPKYPILLPSSIAINGDRADIPNIASHGEFSYTSGFPSITQTPISAGGTPPRRIDFNGIFHELSQHTFYQQSGGMYAWSELLDYPLNALVYGVNNEIYKAIQVSGKSYEAGPQNPVTSTGYWKEITPHLSNATNSTSTTIAATSSAVKSAYDRGSSALTEAQKATGKAYVNATNNSSYIKFSNGVILQWGIKAYAPANQVITLPTPFATTNYVITSALYLGSQGAGTYARSQVTPFNITTTSFTMNLFDSYGLLWFAIGK